VAQWWIVVTEGHQLALDPVTLAALQAQRQLQAEDRQTVGGRYRDHGYVFTWPDGRPLHPENVANWFEQHTRAAGLPRIRLHDVRHSFVLTGADLLGDGPPVGWPLDRPPMLFETSMPGVFAVGDVRHGSIKRVASAVGEGSVAIRLVHEYLSHR
jgi:integrase